MTSFSKKLFLTSACMLALSVPLVSASSATAQPESISQYFDSQSASLTPPKGLNLAGQTITVSPTVEAPDMSRDSYGATDPEELAAIQAAAAEEARVAAEAAAAQAAEAQRVANIGNKQAIVNKAMEYNNVVPYVFGGATPSGWDCSGFVKYVYQQTQGITLGHDVGAEKAAGTIIPQEQAVPGDLVVFNNGSSNYHIGIYIGNDQMIHAPRPGKNTQTVTIWRTPGESVQFVSIF